LLLYLKKVKNQLGKNMAVKGEEIRQAKKFLENKKLSIKHMKPRLFAKVSEDLGKNFDDVLKIIKERVKSGTSNTSDKK
jgi:hypothetical protein